jgi:hypothetical protein
MGKAGTSNFREALVVGSTHGERGITLAVRIGFDDNRALGERTPRTVRPTFREVMLRVYRDQPARTGPDVSPEDRRRDRWVPGVRSATEGSLGAAAAGPPLTAFRAGVYYLPPVRR